MAPLNSNVKRSIGTSDGNKSKARFETTLNSINNSALYTATKKCYKSEERNMRRRITDGVDADAALSSSNERTRLALKIGAIKITN